jgi:signal transduction histidine kinase
MKRWFRRPKPYTRINLMYWLTVCGVLVWGIIVSSGQIPDAPPIQPAPFFIVVGLAAFNLLCRTVEYIRRQHTRNTQRPTRFSSIFVTADLLLVTAGLRFSGGIQSPLWVALFLVGLAETVLASPNEARLIRYGTTLALILGTMPSPAASANGAYFLEIGVRIGAFLAVQSVVRRLREGHDAQETENAALRAELALAEERSHLSREIHDGVGNSLAASVLRLEVAARVLEKNTKSGATDEQTMSLLREEAQALREAMTAVRDWTFFARPWTLPEGIPPSSTLTAEVERLSRRTGVSIKVEGASVLNTLLPSLCLTLIRITQEALTNVAKHAPSATCAEVHLSRDTESILLCISDDGEGFDLSACPPGVGMSSMQERTKGSGGAFQVDSAPGMGTTLTTRFPLS